MNAFQRSAREVDNIVLRWWHALDQPVVLRLAFWVLPLIGGLISMKLGQDGNWDFQNYHWYNAFAYVNGKIGFDLAPGQFQTYFNPTLDLPYYLMATHWPTRVTAFCMGVIHGFNVSILMLITRHVLMSVSPAAGATYVRLPLLLALAGATGFAFLSQMGNTMGDNMTSLSVLGALLLLLRAWPQLLAGGARGALMAVLAGLLIGAGTGLKLTNANYALALCLALLTVPGSFVLRLRTAFVFGLGVLAGIGVSAGHWYWKMWTLFGNPLFPQFNNVFKGALATPIGVADSAWVPKGLFDNLLWPFIFTFNPRRVIELPMTQIIWPLVYLAFIAFAVAWVRRALLAPAPAAGLSGSAASFSGRARFVLVFFVISYVIWIRLFGIYRYLVPLELLAPLAFWLLLHYLCQPQMARLACAWCLGLAMVAGVPRVGWGHHDHTERTVAIEAPHIADPAHSMVMTVHGDPPMSWIATGFPVELAFVALGGGFPESAAYAERVASMVAARKGPLYVMMTARGLQVGKQDDAVKNDEAAEAANRKVLDAAAEVLSRYRLAYIAGTCVVHVANLGTGRELFQLCEVGPMP